MNKPKQNYLFNYIFFTRDHDESFVDGFHWKILDNFDIICSLVENGVPSSNKNKIWKYKIGNPDDSEESWVILRIDSRG